MNEYLADEETCPGAPVPNMSAALFKQQMKVVNDLMKVMGVCQDDPVVGVTDGMGSCLCPWPQWAEGTA